MSVKFFLKNTKIVSTFGPAITFNLNLVDPEVQPQPDELLVKVKKIVRDIFWGGVNCVRYNFSHGAVVENTTRLEVIRRVQREFLDKQKGERKYLSATAMMADTKGPEIRVYDMTKEGISYEKGQEITVNCVEKIQGSTTGFSVFDITGKYNMARDCVVGNCILVEDGKLRLNILAVDEASGRVTVRVMNNHHLKTNKRINLPGADYSMDFLSEKDINDLKYAVDNGFEYAALSFVNTKEHVMEVKNLVASYCKEKGIPNIMKIYSKMETTQSCKNLDEIIEASDGIMVARGDLGLEVPYYEVPYWTKLMIKKCRLARKPVITATQMLDSLERNVVATRAEVSDVYRAAELTSDCTMLSGETAQGQFPVLSVQTMTDIVFESERHLNVDKFSAQFTDLIFDNLSAGVKDQINSLREALNKNKDTNILIIKGEDISSEFLKAVSAMRLKTPVFVFQLVDDVYSYCHSPNWKSASYLKMKEMSELVLYRGINLVFVDGNAKEVSCPELFTECFKAYIEDCCPECCAKNMLCLEQAGGSWKFVSK